MRYVTILILTVMLSGCFSIPFFGGRSKKNPIPPIPEKHHEAREDIKKNIDIIKQLSDIAHTTGIGAYSYESETLQRSAEILQIVTGLPTEKIDFKLADKVKDLHEQILWEEKRYREEKREWENTIKKMSQSSEALAQENSTLRSTLGTVKRWFWISVIALAIITFLFPTVGVAIIKFLLSKTRKAAEVTLTESGKAFKSQMGQVVEAIQDFKEDPSVDHKKLMEYLEKRTDKDTRKLINELKN